MIDVALIGGSGLVGREVSRRLWASGEVNLSSFVRHEPRTRYEHRLSFEKLLRDGGEALGQSHIDVAISCLGTTMRDAGTRGGFRRVDHDYVLAFATAAKRLGARQFILVSSVGARRSSGNYYLSIKGEIEAAVAKLGFERLDVIRPGLLLGNRRQSRLGERIATLFMPLLKPLLRGRLSRYRATRADLVARAIVDLTGAEAPGQFLYENAQLDLVDVDVNVN